MTLWKVEGESVFQQKKDFVVNILTQLKNCNWDIPDHTVHSQEYKVIKNRFTGLVSVVEIARDQLLSDISYAPLKKECNEKIEFFCSDEFKQRPTRREDIEKWDELIDALLDKLEKLN